MEIFLGYDLDGGCYPDVLGPHEATQGVVTAGPARITTILEAHLGLTGAHVHHAVRIGQYLRKLKAADDGLRFYSKSLQVDGWSSARELLSWRDELVLGGWKGDVPAGTKGRLKDLGEVEQLKGIDLAPGPGDRLQTVLLRLAERPHLDIRKIHLIDPQASWPPCRQQLFKALLECGIQMDHTQEKPQSSPSDLGLLKERMHSRRAGADSIRGDGTLCILKASGEWEAAEALASWFEACSSKLGKFVILRGAGSVALDEVLHAHNLPGLGVDSRSSRRAAVQVLPLVLANRWEPVDPHLLLELLILPKSPVPRRVARKFERALRNHPGIGGPEWVKAWEDALLEHRNGSEPSSDVPESGATNKEFERRLKFWLAEDRYNPDPGMPVQVIRDVCARVSRWASSRGGVDEDPLLLASSAIANAVSDAVDATGLTLVSRPQLERILDSVVGEGLENPAACPQAAPWCQVRSPGQIWGPADTVVWWGFTHPGNHSRRSPWTREEREKLLSAGVHLESSSEARARESEAWRKPVKFASNRLVLVVHEDGSEQNGAIHPLFDEIRHLLKLEERDVARLTVDASELRGKKSLCFLGADVERVEAPRDAVPQARREWSVPCPELCVKPREYFTSMQKLIQCPLSWVLEYVLGLVPGELVSLPEGNQMIGTLSHAIVERLFTEAPRWDPASAKARAGELFDELTPQMAVILLHPGRELQRLQHREAVSKGVEQLASFLNCVDLRVAGQEVRKEKRLSEGRQFSGRIDLLLSDGAGRELFMDLKWAQYSKYKRKEMEEGRALQLAAYSWLLSDGAAAYPAGGYYMLKQGEALFPSGCGIPDPWCCSDTDLKTVWNNALVAYDAKHKEIKSGYALAEGIPAADAAPNAEEQTGGSRDQADPVTVGSFGIEAPCRYCNFSTLCGKEGVRG